MSRDWDAEWQEISAAERVAFEKFQESQRELTVTFVDYGNPPNDALSRAEGAQSDWRVAVQRVEDWINEWRAALGRR